MGSVRTGAFTAFGVGLGLASAVVLLVGSVAAGSPVGLIVALAGGCTTELTLRRMRSAALVRLGVNVSAPFVAALALGLLVPLPVDVMVAGSLMAGGVVSWTADVGRRRTAVGMSAAVPVLVFGGLVPGAGAWSVDEPSPSD